MEELQFQEVEDFRPEHLAKRLKVVVQLHELRQRLLNPATFAKAADELRQGLLSHAAFSEKPDEAPPSAPAKPADDDAALLERLLGQPSPLGATTGRGRPADNTPPFLQRLIDESIAPYLAPKADPQQGVYLAAVDSATADQMRAVLHDPSFQTLEATWRSLRRLISNIEDDGQIQVELLDVTAEELRSEVPTNDEQVRQWNLYRRLSNDSSQAVGATPWSIVIADLCFAANPTDIALLSALAITAQDLQTPLIASARSQLLGCPSLVDCPDPTDWQPLDSEISQSWQNLRRSSAAAWVGLVLPRVLLRLPYGKATDEVESFPFEEFSSARPHEEYLWGNPAYLCAELIAQSFASDGWSMELGRELDIGDLPAHTYHEEGEVKLQPCAEVAFGERTADAILQRGLMPLLSWKDRDLVRLYRFQSIADPMTALAGPWS